MLTILGVQGMNCQKCAGHVREALLAVPGVESASVNLGAKQAEVKHGEAATVEQLLKAVEEEGYVATVVV